MKPPPISIPVLGIVAGLGLATSVLSMAARAEAQGADAGAAACATSDDCAPAAPYCRDPDARCVECLTDRNCSSRAAVCDAESGRCVQCRSDFDCFAPEYYCDTTNAHCVECLVDANCEDNLACVSGQCGTCGDGTCALRERISFYGFAPDLPEGIELCPEDCSAACEGIDLGSDIGERLASVDVATLRPRFESTCGWADGADAPFSWTAPRGGTFEFRIEGVTPQSVVVMAWGGCEGSSTNCYFGDERILGDLAAGESILLVLREPAGSSGERHVTITDMPDCDAPGPPPAVCVGEPDGGSPRFMDGGRDATPNAARCLAESRAGAEATCAATECLCERCPSETTRCLDTSGCPEIRSCLDTDDCVGVACYNSGLCRALIDRTGGLSGQAFRAASALQNCALSVPCELTCPPPATDSGPSAPVAPDAGRLCAPARTVTCACDGGTGTRACNAAGSAFGPCDCEPTPPTPRAESDSGCGCRSARSPRPAGAPLAAVLGWIGVWASRRRFRTQRFTCRRES